MTARQLGAREQARRAKLLDLLRRGLPIASGGTGPTVTEIGGGVQGSNATAYTITLSGSASIGDLIVVQGSLNASNAFASGNITDSVGNTYTLNPSGAPSDGTQRSGQWYSILTHAVVGGTTTLTFTVGGSTTRTLLVRAATGVSGWAFDKSAFNSGQASSIHSTTGSTGTLSSAQGAAFANYIYLATPTFTAPAGWSQTATTQQSNSTTYSCSSAYLAIAATTALNPQATLGTAEASGGSILTFLYTGSGSAPVNTVAPAVTGTTTVGSTLTTTNGTWTDDGSPTFTYQWQRDVAGNGVYSNISSATASTYVLVDADDACHVRCNVTDSTPDGNTTQASNAVGVVAEPVATNSVAATITGSAPQGSTLTAVQGTWTHMSGTVHTYAYQWTRAGVNITGATGTTYQTVNADVGHAVGVKETATNTGGTSSATASSNTVTPTTAGFHSGTLTGYTVMVADIVAEWNATVADVGGVDETPIILLVLSPH